MNEYGLFSHEDGSYQERVRHIQLAYASYAAVLALFEITSLLGARMRGRIYGPLIKSPDEDLPQDTQQEQSLAKGEDS